MFKDISYLSSGGPFVQWSGTKGAIMLQGIMGNILNMDQWFMKCRLKIFLILSFGGPFAWRSGTIC